MIHAAARAAPNFALVKYWGKADDEAMIPAAPSLSLTLDGPLVEVSLDPLAEGAEGDEVSLDGAPVPGKWRERTQRFLDLVRQRAGDARPASVRARGGPAPGAGLASSAAYFAALAQAASRAFGLPVDPASVSDLARMGSISAARSVPGGFVALDPSEGRDGRLGAAMLFPAGHWSLAVVVAIVDTREKEVPSSEGMRRTRETSPFHEAWIGSARADFDAALRAIGDRDIEALGRIAESNCLRMHACAMAARPPLLYLSRHTLAAISAVGRLREAGARCFFTVDAGPQVKVVCLEEDVESVRDGMSEVPGIQELLVHRPGPGSLFSQDTDAT